MRISLKQIMLILRRARTVDICAILFLFAWPFAFFGIAPWGNRVLASDDLSSLFLPAGYELAAAIAQGRLPLWTTNLQSGFPLFAEGHIAALYLPDVVLYWLLPPTMALSCAILLHLGWASVGMYILARTAGFRPPSALLAGFVFGFSGFFVAHVQHMTLVTVGSWLPWLVVLQIQGQRALQAQQREWLFWFLAASIVIAFEFFGGYPQFVFVNLGVFVLVGVAAPLLSNSLTDLRQSLARLGPRPFLKACLVTFACIALGMGISAIQWIPAAELLGLSVRSQDLGAEFATSYSMQPDFFLEFLLPFSRLGTPTISNMEYYAYLGLLPILLALIALWRCRDARVWFFLLLGLVCLSLTLGEANPLYTVFSNVPVFNRLRAPVRFLFPFIFAVSFLAAFGFDALYHRAGESKRFGDGATVLAAVMALLTLLIARPDPASAEVWIGTWKILPWILLPMGLALLLLAGLQRINRSVLSFGVLALAFLDLALFAQPFLSTLDTVAAPSDLTSPPQSVRAMDDSGSAYRVFTNIYNDTFRPNHLLIYGKQSPQIYSPLGLERNETYLGNLNSTLLNLLNVRYYVLPSGPLPEEFSQPTQSVLLDLFQDKADFPPTQVALVEIVSYTDGTANVPDGFLAGDIVLTGEDGKELVLPLRMGVETADWARDGVPADVTVNHAMPPVASRFPAYLISSRRQFEGLEFRARYAVILSYVTSIRARSYLPSGKLVIENVSLIDSAGRSTKLTQLVHRNDLALVFKSHAVTVLENRDVLPRALLVHQAEIWDDQNIWKRLKDPGFRPERTVLLASGQPLSQDEPSQATDSVTITEYRPERVAVAVATDRPGYLLLTDSWYPGWQAWMDGEPVPISRADYIFRAVGVPPGKHTVVFEFRPSSFLWGALISGLSLSLLAGLAIAGIWRQRRRAPESHRACESVEKGLLAYH